MGALAGPLARQEGHERGLFQLVCREEVDECDGHLGRRTVGRAVESHEPGLGLNDSVVARPRVVGPIAVDFDDDQARVALAERLGVGAEAGGLARTVRRDDEVGRVQEAAEDGLAGVGAEVERDGRLAPVGGAEVGGPVVGGVFAREVPAARDVAARRLDLDDPRPVLGEEHPDARAGEHARQLDDDEVRQRRH